MSTPTAIEVVRAQNDWWLTHNSFMPPHTRSEYAAAIASVLADAERLQVLEREAADSAEEWAFCGLGVGSAAAAAMKHMEILKKYREQSARLRAALEVELAENQTLKFSTPTGAFVIFATKQKWRLKAALNGEEAST